MQNFSSIMMAAAMIAAFLLAAGGVKLVPARQTRGRGTLVILAALVMITNVMIWTV